MTYKKVSSSDEEPDMNRESYDLNNDNEQITVGNNVKTRKEKIINKLHSRT